MTSSFQLGTDGGQRWRDLGMRMATAAVAIPLVIVGLLWLPISIIIAIFGLTMAIGAHEWSRLVEAGAAGHVMLIFVTLALTAFGVKLILVSSPVASIVFAVGVAMGLLASLAGVWMVCTAATEVPINLIRGALGWFFGAFVFIGALAALASIGSGVGGGQRILMFFVLIWLVDVGGYAAGRLIGGFKLAPRVSPRKTWAGAIAGVAAAAVAAGIYGGLFNTDADGWVFALAGAWLAMVSIFGDLTVSLLKRRAGLAETGVLFPGHGGVLDRLDGLVFAAPWFALIALWLFFWNV